MESSIRIHHRVTDTRFGHHSHHVHDWNTEELTKKIGEEMERDNKEVHAHDSIDSAVFYFKRRTDREAGTSEPREQQIQRQLMWKRY